MCRDFYVTKSVLETLNLSLITKIDAAICSINTEIDYLQIFQVIGDRLIHSQEVPQYTKEYPLEEKRIYWTVMYPCEY